MCDGLGWSYQEDRHYPFLEAEEQKQSHHVQYMECKCNKERKQRKELEQTLRGAKIPEKFIDASISNFDLMKYQNETARGAAAYAKRMSARFIDKFEEIKDQGKGIYFYSRVKGSGKTRLAISIGNALFKKHGLIPLFVPATGIFSEIQATFDSDKSTTKVVNAFKNAQVLIIDDIGVEESSSRRKDRNVWKERTMYEILEHRMNNKLISFFTANIAISKLSGDTLYPGGRVESRVNKMSFEIQMPEESIINT